MGARNMTVGRYEEIRRRLGEGHSVREIARALGCSRRTVREVRDGLRGSPDAPKGHADPLWMLQLEWPAIIHELGLGHPLKFIWEEKAQHLTSYSNFWKQFYRKFPQYREAAVTAREFEPPGLRAVDEPVCHRCGASPPQSSERQGNRRRFGQNPDALYACTASTST
jgi:hypothetical protein